MGLKGSLNLRIGDRDSGQVASVRNGAAVGRSRTALSDVDGDRARSKDQGVVVRLSAAAQKILGQPDQSDGGDPGAIGGRGDAGEGGGAGGADDAPDGSAAAATTGGKKLSPKEQAVVAKLEARDTAVRAHEAAHQAAASGLGGAASFTYEEGPDGRRYAVGGEVPVSLEPGRTPQETISNAETVRAAALAPSDPSAQDLAVAAQATQMEAAARQEMAQRRTEGAADGSAGAISVGKVGAPADGGTVAAVGSDGSAAAHPSGGADETKIGGAPGAAATPDSEHASLMVFSALHAERAEGTQATSAAAAARFRRAVSRYAAA